MEKSPYFVYILESTVNGKFYTGVAMDVAKRLGQHNQGKVKATQYIRPLKLVYWERWATATEAKKREHYIKSQKSRKFIQQLIAGRLALRGGVRFADRG